MSRVYRYASAAIGLFALMASIAVSQEPNAAKKALGEGKTTLYLVLRTGQEEEPSEIIRNIEKALKHTKAGYEGKPKIRTVSPTFFEEYASLVDQAANAAEGEVGSLGIKRLASRDTIYELTIDPAQILKKLTVEYKDGQSVDYIPAGPGEKSPLTLIVPGRYAFVPEESKSPKSYTTTVAEFGKKDITKANPWPVGDKYFVVTLSNYIGNKDELFSALRNPAVVASPFDVKRGDDQLFAFADLNSKGATQGSDELTYDTITLGNEDLPESKVRRVWTYFPLDEASAKQAIEDFRKDGLRSVALSKKIREQAVNASEENVTVRSTDSPKWFELPRLPREKQTPNVTFQRTIKVDDLRQMYTRFPNLYRLVVWEFDNDADPPEAILINAKDPAVGKTYVDSREFLGFNRRAEAMLRKKNNP